MPISSAACLHRLDAVAQGVARGDVRPERRHALPVEPVDAGRALGRSGSRTTLSSRVSPARSPSAAAIAAAARAGRGLRRSRAHVELRDRLAAAAVDAHQPQLHVVDVVELRVAVARDAVVAADGHPQRLGDLLHVDAQRGRPLAVDVDQQFRLVELQRVVGVDDARQISLDLLRAACR